MAMIDDSADMVLINVQSEAEFEEAHIPGSFNIPVDEPDFEVRVAELVDNPARKVVVYSSGPDDDASTEAAERLEGAGFSDVAEYEGGLQEWVDTGNEVEAS
jgi:rhodanese-related sulfurtransferase